MTQFRNIFTGEVVNFKGKMKVGNRIYINYTKLQPQEVPKYDRHGRETGITEKLFDFRKPLYVFANCYRVVNPLY